MSATVRFSTLVLVMAAVAPSGCATRGLRTDIQTLQVDLEVCTVTSGTLGMVADTAAAALETTAAVAELEGVARQLGELKIKAQEEMLAQLQASFDAGDLEVVTRDGQMVIQLPGEVLFAPGQAELTEEGRVALARVALVLRSQPGRFLVAGHTDDVPVAAGPRYRSNRELSILRSLSAVEVLETEGVAPEKLVAAGFGEHQPLRANGSEDNRASNRRLEILFLPQVYGDGVRDDSVALILPE